MSDESIKITDAFEDDNILQTVEKAGFLYDGDQDVFYSGMNPWQRKYGYCQLYDEACPPISLIIDCEPIRFRYGGKKWLIEFWKGQYGMTTGAEIGVYNTEGPDLNIPGVFNGTLYHAADEEDHLQIFYALRKGKKMLFTREGKHWWLTGFILGEFANPEELSLEARITLKSKEMCDAFVNQLIRVGYTDEEVRSKNKTAWVTFSRPYSEQPTTRTKLVESVSQNRNRYLCEKYQELTGEAGSIIEKLSIVRSENPEMFDRIIHMGKPSELFTQYESLSGET